MLAGGTTLAASLQLGAADPAWLLEDPASLLEDPAPFLLAAGHSQSSPPGHTAAGGPSWAVALREVFFFFFFLLCLN